MYPRPITLKCCCKWTLRSVLNRCCRPAVFLRRQLMALIKHTGGRLMSLHTTRDFTNGSAFGRPQMSSGSERNRAAGSAAPTERFVSPRPARPRPPPRSSPGNESSSLWAPPASAASARPPALYSAGSPPARAHAKKRHNKDELDSGHFPRSHQLCFSLFESCWETSLPARCLLLEIKIH